MSGDDKLCGAPEGRDARAPSLVVVEVYRRRCSNVLHTKRHRGLRDWAYYGVLAWDGHTVRVSLTRLVFEKLIAAGAKRTEDRLHGES